MRIDLENALNTTRAHPLQSVDHLCCGNMGRADILLEAGRQLARPELIAAARGITLEGAYQLLPGLPKEALFPGFFQGSAGIGYTLLRQAFPDQLPCVLAWRR